MPRVVSAMDNLDAVILPPIGDRGGHALRRQIERAGIPCLAESAPQSCGAYLGPDNFDACLALGKQAGREHRHRAHVSVLMIDHRGLSNTELRADGFLSGLRKIIEAPIEVTRINGRGSYRLAFQQASDAFQANDNIDIVFGVNDHSALAGLDAAKTNDCSADVYAVGGESADVLALTASSRPLRAVAALFPTVVGAMAIDALALALCGETLPESIITPHRIVTGANLYDFYQQHENGIWSLRDDVFAALAPHHSSLSMSEKNSWRIGFMPHFPAHDWYRAMIQSMQHRAAGYAMTLDLIPPDQGISEQLARLQQQIAETAASRVCSNETVIIGEGCVALAMARELRRRAQQEHDALLNVTVITNALDVLFELQNASEVTTVLTSGEYRADARCLVGPSVGALFERMRAEKAFVSIAGLSTRFGLSAADDRRALANACFVAAARHTIVLADHTLIGTDANHRICHIKDIDEVITDDDVLPADRQQIRSAGVNLCIATDASAEITSPTLTTTDEHRDTL